MLKGKKRENKFVTFREIKWHEILSKENVKLRSLAAVFKELKLTNQPRAYLNQKCFLRRIWEKVIHNHYWKWKNHPSLFFFLWCLWYHIWIPSYRAGLKIREESISPLTVVPYCTVRHSLPGRLAHTFRRPTPNPSCN